MMRWPGLCLLLLLSSVRVMAINAVVSHSTFYVTDYAHPGHLMPSVETYWEISPASVHYSTTAEKTIVARIRTDITFTAADGSIIKQDRFILQTTPRTRVEDLSSHPIIDLRKYDMPPGKVKLKFVLTDMADTTNRYVYRDSFTLATPGNDPFYSELQLLDTIISVTDATRFKKNGRQQIPSAANFLDDHKNTLLYYGERYEMGKIPENEYPLVQKVSLHKKENELSFGKFLKIDTISKPGGSNYFSGTFPLETIASGNYHVNVRLENNYHRVLASTSLFVQRMNTNPVTDTTKAAAIANLDTAIESVTVLNLDKTFLVKYSTPEIRAMLKMLLPFSDYTGTQTINGFLKKPDEMYMRYYVYNYFASLNKNDPAKAWKSFSDKIIEVNKMYSGHGTPGYETDRGRIYLRYGAPSEVITEENETGSWPYEIWQYNVLKQQNGKEVANAIFLFYKPNQTIGEFKILHSTVSGEGQNTAWRNYLYNATQGGNNMNSRAEQYLGNR